MQVYEKKLGAGTFRGYFWAVKAFVIANEDELGADSIRWDRLSRGLPPSRSCANDREPRQEEIQKLVKNYSDRRLKPIVYVLCSCGMRYGALHKLRWKHVIPVSNWEYLTWRKEEEKRNLLTRELTSSS